MEKDTVLLYSDGACIPNPGAMGIGGVLVFNGHTKEYSKELGEGTNNIAELTAISYGLTLISDKSIPVIVVSDSQYALNCLSGKWNPKKNIAVINDIKRLIAEFDSVGFKWVRGHAGDKHNERADELANQHLPDAPTWWNNE
jgi:ribonuclease HI